MAIARRDLLRLAAWGSAALAAGCRKRREPDPRVTLDEYEWRTLEAITERILPGASEAGVVTFIDRQLATPELAPVRPALKLTVQLLDAYARDQLGALVVDLDAAKQDRVVAALAAGTIPTSKPFPQREAFRALHLLTLEGYLSDPVHGGNRDMVGWKAIGFAEPPLRTPGGAHGHH